MSCRTGPLRVGRPLRGVCTFCCRDDLLGPSRWSGSFFSDNAWLVAGDRGVDGAGPGVDAAGKGLDLLEALVAQPHSDTEGAGAVMAENDDRGVGVELGVGAGGDFAHGHEERVGEAGGLVLPGFADV
jgi:hypothetical protein